MFTKQPAIWILALFVLAILFGSATPLPAQLMSKWGHPAFTVGATPYDSVNQGHGNYPGSPGFIPGYGYYPGSGPGHYPWLDGPGTPFDRRQIVAQSADDLQDAAQTALVIVKLPAQAELWFDGWKTAQKGSCRSFRTPALATDHLQSYTVQVRWRIRDANLSRIEHVAVSPGGVFMVDFLTADSWTGRRMQTTSGADHAKDPIQQLGLPRRLPQAR